MTRPIPRQRYLDILRAALAAQNHRFARLAALDWLAAYPGDLTAGLLYGRALLGERRLPQAIAVLQGLRRADPEFLEAVEALVATDDQAGGSAGLSVRTHYQALTGREIAGWPAAPWGGALWRARRALEQGDLNQAGELIGACLQEADNLPLAGVLHLRYLAANPRVDAGARREIALGYHQRWPDCIACMLWLAQSSLEIGEADYAVALFHQAAARDIGGQVVQRLWGPAHPYRALWPERLELPLLLPIPAEVSAWLGTNRLPQGADPGPALEPPAGQEPVAGEASDGLDLPGKGLTWSGGADCLPAAPPAEAWEAGSQPPEPDGQVADLDGLGWALADPEGLDLAGKTLVAAAVAGGAGLAAQSADPAIWNPFGPQAGAAAPPPGLSLNGEAGGAGKSSGAVKSNGAGKSNGARPRQAPDPELGAVSQEFDRLARRFKLPAVARQDGRFPVYVLFSVRSRLEAVYGKPVADLLVSEMGSLAETVDRRKGWSARVFLPDDPATMSSLGMAPIRSIDPWELKLALVDLDAALSRRGERIGALLIVGGPEIIPFHCLPNPVDDQDDDIPTDNPYATRDENYFIPEWPVGRMPGGAESDARLILQALRRSREAHEAGLNRLSWLQRLLLWLRKSLGRASAPASQSAAELLDRARLAPARQRAVRRSGAFGYTAAIWRQAAGLVFRPIGKPAALSVSPPFGIDGTAQACEIDEIDAAGKIPALRGRLAYFNLHGLVDAPEWYGQRDPLGDEADPDYPVALRPKDILLGDKNAWGEIPQVIFSEACYGLHIQGRPVQGAISLSFLQAGSLAVVGSTCMAYGSIGAPLAAADLLGHTFWRYLQEGFTVGEALRQAKIHLASLMSQRQGYLDGEDQKTLLSFILYGDPLAQPVATERAPKSQRYLASSLAHVPLVCERTLASEPVEPMPAEVIASVRRVVAHYLPGMSDARLTLVHPRSTCPGEGHACPTSQLEHPAEPAAAPPAAKNRRGRNGSKKSKGVGEDLPSLVTLSKQVTLPNGVHPRVARLTLDERGKLVKLVVSR